MSSPAREQRPIIALGRAHRDAAAATLAAAFADDPAMCYMLPDVASRPRRMRRLFGWMIEETLRIGLVLGSEDAAVVTLWRPPGSLHVHTPVWHPSSLRFIPIFGRHIPRAIRVDDGIQSHLPREDAWMYLKIAGVRPDAQGQGLGGAAIREGIARGTAAGVPALLETATPGNVPLYRSLGFDMTTEWDVPKGGPHFWQMARPPA